MTHYTVLGVDARATEEAIRTAFKVAALHRHPDKAGTSDDAPNAGAHERMSELNEAYYVLRDPVRRAQYDQSTARSNGVGGAAGGHSYSVGRGPSRPGGNTLTAQEVIALYASGVRDFAAHTGHYIHVLRDVVLIRSTLNGAIFSGAYMGGADLQGAKMRHAKLAGASLREADLRGADLYNADLSNNLPGVLPQTDLRGANLNAANLSFANLENTDLSTTGLTGADLSGANLTGARLRGAKLAAVDLRGANLRGADLSGATLAGADLRKADLRRANLRDANLVGAKLDGTRLDGATLGGTILTTAELTILIQNGHISFAGAVLPGARLEEVDLKGADLSDANLCSASLNGAQLRELYRLGRRDFNTCKLRDVDLCNANLSNAKLRSADLTGANLRCADLSGADLTGAYLGNSDLRGANLTGSALTDTDDNVKIDRFTIFWGATREKQLLKVDSFIQEYNVIRNNHSFFVTLRSNVPKNLVKSFGELTIDTAGEYARWVRLHAADCPTGAYRRTKEALDRVDERELLLLQMQVPAAVDQAESTQGAAGPSRLSGDQTIPRPG